MSNLDPVVHIGDWYYQVIYGQLWPADAPTEAEQMIRLEPRLHSLLNFFLLHPNKLLAKDTLIEKVWPAEEGTDAAVMRAVGALRKVLGDDVRTPRYIATVSKKGYCWLAEINAVPSFALQQVEADNTLMTTAGMSSLGKARERLSWRFISVTALIVLLSCASLAYILASYTAAPLVKLPDTLSPISALSGQEYWPVLNEARSHVVYQHKAPDASAFSWSVQQLADLRVEHTPQTYLQLSQPQWLNAQHIVFRGRSNSQDCYFYQQQMLPEPATPVALWPCNTVIPQALVAWNGQWLWLDTVPGSSALQLWSGMPGSAATLMHTLDGDYFKLNHMLVLGNSAYLLAQETVNNAVLLKLDLSNGVIQTLQTFAYAIEQFSWWDDKQLLLSPVNQELQIFNIKHQTIQRLGPLTRELTQATRYGNQVLATQFLDYTTDILRIKHLADGAVLIPWHVSNRSERLVAASEQGVAFVSERAGHSQIWLAQGSNSIQLSRLHEHQQIQQLLWHNGELLVLIDSQLYALVLDSSELRVYPLQSDKPGRYASCNGQLYWTELTPDGWMLLTERGQHVQAILPDVVDVRCAPQQRLVIQFTVASALALLDAPGQLLPLPVTIDWREQNAEQWFVDDSGIYWLAADNAVVNVYSWESNGIEQALTLPETQKPVALYSDGHGVGYIVRPRPHDTDIVWLQNRR